MIKFNFTNEGGFVAGDTDTGHTSYAYPASIHAKQAKREPAKVAAEMMAGVHQTNPYCYPEVVKTYDAHNWPRIVA